MFARNALWKENSKNYFFLRVALSRNSGVSFLLMWAHWPAQRRKCYGQIAEYL